MKKSFFFNRWAIVLMALLMPVMYAYADKVEKRTNLYTGETTCADDWSAGWKKFAAALFADCKAGDKVVVTVSAVSPTCAHPQVYLQNGKWANFNPNLSSAVSEPGEVVFSLTQDVISTISDTGGLIVKGCGYTFTSVDLIQYVNDGTGNTIDVTVSLPIWYCHTTCPDGWGNSEYIPAEKFAAVTTGAALKVHVIEKSPTAKWPQARLNTKGYAKMSESAAISEVGIDYTLLIPDNMIDEIRTNGVRVSGGGYTFDRVTLVSTVPVITDPKEASEMVLFSDYNNADIREFKGDEQPVLHFALVNPELEEQTVDMRVVLTDDMENVLKTYEWTVTAGAGDGQEAMVTDTEANLADAVTAPGVYHFKASANGKTFCAYNIAYQLENIDCQRDAKDDFEQFWAAALDELAAISPEYTIEEYTEGKKDSDTRVVYKVTMKSTPNVVGEEPVTVGGLLAVPVGEETVTHPVLVKFQGTDNGTGKLTVPSRTETNGWCEFVFSTRGQMLNRADQSIYCPEGNSSPDYYAYGLGDMHQHYYYGAHLDCVRAIDFLAQYPGADANNIFAMGGSQGGALTYVTAALDHRVKAIAPSITGHADFRHNVQRVGWPKNVFENFLSTHPDWDWEQLFGFLSYFDVKNFASMITCPVITNFSLQDTTDPTHCNIVPYLLLSQVDEADKEYSLNPFLGHATAPNFTDDAMAFFMKYLSTGQPTVTICPAKEYTTFCSTRALDFSEVEGLTAYAVTSVNKDHALAMMTELTQVAAGEGIILHKTGDATTYEVSVISEAEPAAGNKLVGVTEPTVIGNEAGYTHYIISAGKLYETDESTLAAGKAYLRLADDEKPDLSGASANGISLAIETTGISENVTELQTPADGWYNLSGQRVSGERGTQLPKGIYIIGGKKVIIK